MAEKSEYVDMISEATRQRRRTSPRLTKPAGPAKETRRLSNWPPERWSQWRVAALTPWKLKPWRVDD